MLDTNGLQQAESRHAQSQGRGAETLEISTAMVRIYKNQFGRGPTSSRTDYAGPNLVVCSLYGSLTPAEQNLRDMGEEQRLRDVRLFFQYASEKEFRGEIERITGRTVTAFASGMDVSQDIAIEIFYLEPVASG